MNSPLTTVDSGLEPNARIGQALSASDHNRSARALLWLVLVTFLCHCAGQLHGIIHPTFLNLDVAGIVYNARLLLAGRLPYVDSIEIKPPGAFILFAPWLAIGGLRAVWIFSTFWATSTS